jgi:hypothetical protein
MPRVPHHMAGEDTPLKDIYGIGPSTFSALGAAGYPLKPRSTLGDYRKATKSFDALQAMLKQKGIGQSFLLTKLRNLWSGAQAGGMAEVQRPASSTEAQDTNDRVQAAAGNFLLGSGQATGNPEGEDPSEDEEPEVDAMHRECDPTKAVAEGFLQPSVDPTVIPDPTLNVSPDDKEISGRMQLLPFTPAPVTPAIAIGPLVSQVRKTVPVTMEQLFESMKHGGQNLPGFKASGEKDMGSDSYGNLMYDERVGKDTPQAHSRDSRAGGMDDGHITGKKRRWNRVPMTIDEPEEQTVDKESYNDREHETQKEMRQFTRHPFKQATLFRNHDARASRSKQLLDAVHERITTSNISAAAKYVQLNDPSYYRDNAMTQGVIIPYQPSSAMNFNQKDLMITDFQENGPAPLFNQWWPSPYEIWRTQGGFH